VPDRICDHIGATLITSTLVPPLRAIDGLSIELSACDQLLDCCRQICHGIDDNVGSRVGKALGEFPVCVAGARETDRGHAGCPGGFDAEDGILNHDAA
jgi:hypothetical protein